MANPWDAGAAAIAATLPFTDREAVAPGLSDLVSGSAGNTWPDRYRRALKFYSGPDAPAEDMIPAGPPAKAPGNPWDEFKTAGAPAAPSAEASPWDEFRAAPEPTREIPAWETALSHGAKGLSAGTSPRLRGLYAAGEGTGAEHGSPLTTAADLAVGLYRKLRGDPEAEQRYEEAKAAEEADLEATRSANSKTAALSQFVGAIPTAAAMGSVAPAVRGAGMLPRIATGASQGATIGLGFGLGEGGSAGDVAGSTLWGAAGGAVIPLAAEGVRAGARAIGKQLARAAQVNPTPAAKALEAAGVEGLTAGQRAGPGSIVGQLESVSSKIPMGVEAERQAAKQSWMRVAQNKGTAPGATTPASTDLQTRLKALLEGFQAPYAKVQGYRVAPEAVESALKSASMPGRGVDAATAAGVKAEVENALTVIGYKPPAPVHVHGHGATTAKLQGLVDQFGREIPAAPPPPPKATVGDLMKVRENIREAIRAARQGQDFDRLRLLEGAEDVITDAIEKSLPEDAAALLRNTDRQYARLMTATNAAPAGQTEFTPLQYLRQVERGSGRRAFKTGSAGDLQDLGENARQVFVDAPQTGWTTRVIDWVPGGTRLTAPVARAVNWANSPAGKRFMQSYPQSPAIKSRVPPDVAAFISSRAAPALRFAPSAASDGSEE